MGRRQVRERGKRTREQKGQRGDVEDEYDGVKRGKRPRKRIKEKTQR